MGFATAHLEVIKEPGRPVSQAGELLAGQDELGERGSLWSLSVSPSTPVSILRFISFMLILSHTRHCDRIESSHLVDANNLIMEMAGEQTELGQRRKLCLVSFSICFYVYLSDLSIFFSLRQTPANGVWRIRHMSVVCVYRFVYVFKVGRFCLTRTIEHRDLGEDRRLPLYVYTVRKDWMVLKETGEQHG